MQVTIFGAGNFGTALGQILTENQHHVNFYDPLKFPTQTLSVSLKSTEVQLLALPSNQIKNLLPNLNPSLPLISASKGLFSLAPFLNFSNFTVLSGGAFAEDLKKHLPATLTTTSSLATKLLKTDWLTIEQTSDTLGVMFCGSLKNIYAIGAGRLNLQPHSSDLHRYLLAAGQEIQDFLHLNHAQVETFQLSCGFADLKLTCSSSISRNYRFGQNPKLRQGTIEGLSAAHNLLNIPHLKLPPQAKLLKSIINFIKSLE